jgi:pimeloyl-ACP methyl ester carboxylesterase
MAYVQIDDVRLAYDDVGSGPELLLLHGYPFNRSLWTEQVNALSGTFRVITPDLRGFGESELSEGVSTMNRMAQDVGRMMDALEIPNAVVGGLSMGGYVVLAFYKQFASRVRGSCWLTLDRKRTRKKPNKCARNSRNKSWRRAWLALLMRCCPSC